MAYVQDFPSFDGPNQRAFVERSDKSCVMYITAFAEDVDFTERIVWSPDNLIVVFHSKDYLTVTRITDWRTVKVSLACQWERSEARGRVVNTCGGPNRKIDRIEFPRPGVIAYHVTGEAPLREIDLNVLSRKETITQSLPTCDVQ